MYNGHALAPRRALHVIDYSRPRAHACSECTQKPSLSSVWCVFSRLRGRSRIPGPVPHELRCRWRPHTPQHAQHETRASLLSAYTPYTARATVQPYNTHHRTSVHGVLGRAQIQQPRAVPQAPRASLLATGSVGSTARRRQFAEQNCSVVPDPKRASLPPRHPRRVAPRGQVRCLK